MVCKLLLASFTLALVSMTVADNGSAFQLHDRQQDWSGVQCPDRCQCVYRLSDRFQAKLRTVDCSGAGYSHWPVLIPTDTQSLVLRRNRIRSPFDAHIWLPDLVQLDLSHNGIAAIGDDQSTDIYRRYHSQRNSFFDGVYNLRLLDLSGNQLTNLDNGAFEGLFNLEELNLAQNRIARIADDAFRGLFKLETLKLSSNRLAYVQSNWWHHIRTLYDLSLDGNYINVAQGENFNVLNNLIALNLARNRIFRIYDNAFAGLSRLENLNLQGNSLSSLNREALRRVSDTLKSINIGRNPMLAICTDDFANLSQLKDISINGMPRLRVIERGAFKNLPELLIIEMHDNPYLAYVDAAAFVNAPKVTHLLIHNNNLTVLEREVIDALPSLEETSLYGNPLTCDCNVRWIHEMAKADFNGDRRINFPEFDRLVCDSPSQHRFKLFGGLRSIDFGDKCIRMIENLFDEENERKIGDDITYRCRVIGTPKPKLFWTAPSQNQRPIDAGVYHPRRVLYNGNTLVLRKIKPEDAGPYVCSGENEAGTVTAATRLTVADIQIRLHALRIGSTTATLTWNGTDRENHLFQILFRRSDEHQRQYAATVTPIMKTYTVYNLQPHTEYEACITLVDGDEVVVNISCARFKTGQLESAFRRMERTGNVAVGAALGIVSCMLIVVCLAAVALKRSCLLFLRRLGAGGQPARHRASTISLDTAESSLPASNLTFCSIENLYDPLLSNGSTQTVEQYVARKPWNTLISIDQDVAMRA